MKKLILLIVLSLFITGCEKKGNLNDAGVILIDDNLVPEWVKTKEN